MLKQEGVAGTIVGPGNVTKVVAPALWTPSVLNQALIGSAGARKVYISGLCALTNDGEVYCPGDIGAQVDRTFDRLEQLFSGGPIKPQHIQKIIHVFVDFEVAHLSHIFRNVPRVFANAPLPTSTGTTAPRLELDGMCYMLICEGVIADAAV